MASTLKVYNFIGLSTDTKPKPENIATGSTFKETDTGAEFIFDRKTNMWVKVVPTTVQIDNGAIVDPTKAVTIGIYEIKKTSTTGRVDTYTIYYTNGAETTFEVTNGAGQISWDAEFGPSLFNANRPYSLTIDETTKEFDSLITLTLNDSEEDPDYIRSELLSRELIWPRTKDGKFLAKYQDLNLVFYHIFGDYPNDLWQALEIDENGKFIRYTGHFEDVTDDAESDQNLENEVDTELNTDEESGIYFFKCNKQTISFNSLEAQVSQKQDKLIPGKNITISEDNVISATGGGGGGGDYTAGKGIHISDDDEISIDEDVVETKTQIYVDHTAIDPQTPTLISLENNKTFNYLSSNITSFTIDFPEQCDPGLISEVIFNGNKVKDNKVVILSHNKNITYVEFGREVTRLSFSSANIVDLIFQYDGVNRYCYIYEIR